MIYGMDEARKMQKKEYDKAVEAVEREKELAVARERARLSVLDLNTKDKDFLRKLKVKF